MQNQHDHSYKLLFSDPRTIRDLITGFIKEEWVERLDLDSLEKISGSYITDDLRDREDDIVWRVKFDDEYLYVYLLLEFQSTVDKYMAIRIMTYIGLLYQDLIKQQKRERTETHPGDGKLPPVLPIVLYNGERHWNAALSVQELVKAVPGGLEKYLPSVQYMLLDEKALASNTTLSDEAQNVVQAIFRLENASNHDDFTNVVGLLVEWLKTPEQTHLRRSFVVWIRRVLLSKIAPADEHSDIQSLQELNEVHTMLAERAEKWSQKLINQGRSEERIKVALDMIRKTSMSDDLIAELSRLTVDKVKELRSKSDK